MRAESVDAAVDYIRFWAAGESAKGDFRCSECSYGVTVHTTLPVCPMCAGSSWEQIPWSPFSRAERRH
jgi:rubredoxin